jgi:hypothetical protein
VRFRSIRGLICLRSLLRLSFDRHVVVHVHEEHVSMYCQSTIPSLACRPMGFGSGGRTWLMMDNTLATNSCSPPCILELLIEAKSFWPTSPLYASKPSPLTQKQARSLVGAQIFGRSSSQLLEAQLPGRADLARSAIGEPFEDRFAGPIDIPHAALLNSITSFHLIPCLDPRHI